MLGHPAKQGILGGPTADPMPTFHHQDSAFMNRSMASALLVAALAILGACKRAPEPGPDAAGADQPDPLKAPVLTEGTPPASPDTSSIVLILPDQTVPFHQEQARLLRERSSQTPHIRLLIEESANSPDAQRRQIEDLLAAPPGVLILCPVPGTDLAPPLQKLRATGCRIIAMPQHPGGAPFDLFDVVLQSDAATAGGLVADHILETLQKRAGAPGREDGAVGRIVILRGSDDDPWTSLMQQALASRIDAANGVRIVHDAPAGWLSSGAAPRLREALRLQHEFQVVFAHDDELARAAHLAAVQAGIRDGLLVIGVNGFPGEAGGLRMIQRHEIDATLRRPLLVDTALDRALALLAADQPARLVTPEEFPCQIITPALADDLLSTQSPPRPAPPPAQADP
jgi:ABC-type sugar transport system substrate-binding protein